MSPLPQSQAEALVSSAPYGALNSEVVDFQTKIGIKKIHSSLSKHKLNNCNLLYVLWHWRDRNSLLRCCLWMHSLPLLSPLQALHYLKLSLDMLATELNAYKYCYFAL